jgi:hypothetical protein
MISEYSAPRGDTAKKIRVGDSLVHESTFVFWRDVRMGSLLLPQLDEIECG